MKADLQSLHDQRAALFDRSTAKIAELDGEGIDDGEVARIEGEHKVIMSELESVNRAISAQTKPWISQFLMSAAKSGLDAYQLNEIVAASGDLNGAKTMLIDRMHANDAHKPARWGVNPTDYNGGSLDDPAFAGKACEDAFYALITKKPIDGPGRELAAGGTRRVLHAIASARGEKLDPWMSSTALVNKFFMAGGALSTSDFPNILGGSLNRVLVDGYQQATSALLPLARPRDIPDFRDITVLRLGEASKLGKVVEGGAIQHGSRVEEKQKYKIGTYGNLFGITRQALANDDLGAFNNIVVDMGRAAAGTLADEFVAVLTDNTGDGQDLDDGNPVYSTTRGNKAGSGTVIDVDNLAAARQALREMKGVDGVTPIAVTPKFLVVGPAKETEAEKILHTISAVQVDDVNPFGGALTLAVEPRLTGNAWRLFADPAMMPCFEVAYLANSNVQGSQGGRAPFIESRLGWDVLGVEFRVVFDFGVAMIDWRGTYLNSGN